jgi:hypothetical protein
MISYLEKIVNRFAKKIQKLYEASVSTGEIKPRVARDTIFHFYVFTIPANPMKANDNNPAVIKAIGAPFMASGIS